MFFSPKYSSQDLTNIQYNTLPPTALSPRVFFFLSLFSFFLKKISPPLSRVLLSSPPPGGGGVAGGIETHALTIALSFSGGKWS
jgi:hypothetical protein